MSVLFVAALLALAALGAVLAPRWLPARPGGEASAAMSSGPGAAVALDGGAGGVRLWDEEGDTLPSLFCCSLVVPYSYQEDLIKQQYERGQVGIFDCDEWAVYSNTSFVLSHQPTQMWATSLPGGPLATDGDIKDRKHIETKLFVRLWDQILKSSGALSHDWTVKVNPDTVFFPQRLRSLLREKWAPSGKSGDKISLRHCYNSIVPLYPDHGGPIEVFSQQALRELDQHRGSCARAEPTDKGEFVGYKGLCRDHFESKPVDAFNLLSESMFACNDTNDAGDTHPACFDPHVAFHPFRSVDSFFECRKWAISHHWKVEVKEERLL